MESAHTSNRSHEIAVPARATLCSFETVDHDQLEESYRVTYDSSVDRPSMAVISVVATVLGRDPDTLGVLNEVVDPDALDALFRTFGRRNSVPTVAFEYGGCSVVVDGDTVTVRPSEGGRGREGVSEPVP